MRWQRAGVGGGGSSGSDAAVPSVAPSVTTQPQSQSVTTPSTATFTAAAGGVPTPNSQWQVSTDGRATFSNIIGATALSYTTPATSVAGSGKRYRVVFSNSAGMATSNSATLTVNPLANLALLARSPGGPGNLDGNGAAAHFYGPAGAAVDGSGTIYVADTYNHTIRKIHADRHGQYVRRHRRLLRQR